LRSLEKRLTPDWVNPLAFLEKAEEPPFSGRQAAPSLSILEDGSISRRHFPNLEHGPLAKVNAIVLHQSASASAENTLKAYQKQTLGTHFFIARDGKIYQTAALDQITWHVGEIRPRDKKVTTCSETEYERKGPVVARPAASHRKGNAKD